MSELRSSIECGGAEVIKIHARRVPVLLGWAWVAGNFKVQSDIATRQRDDFYTEAGKYFAVKIHTFKQIQITCEGICWLHRHEYSQRRIFLSLSFSVFHHAPLLYDVVLYSATEKPNF